MNPWISSKKLEINPRKYKIPPSGTLSYWKYRPRFDLTWPMFSLPERFASSPVLQRPGAFLNYVNDICVELCDTIQANVSRVYQELTNSPSRKKHSAAAVFELKRLHKKRKWVICDVCYSSCDCYHCNRFHDFRLNSFSYFSTFFDVSLWVDTTWLETQMKSKKILVDCESYWDEIITFVPKILNTFVFDLRNYTSFFLFKTILLQLIKVCWHQRSILCEN